MNVGLFRNPWFIMGLRNALQKKLVQKIKLVYIGSVWRIISELQDWQSVCDTGLDPIDCKSGLHFVSPWSKLSLTKRLTIAVFPTFASPRRTTLNFIILTTWSFTTLLWNKLYMCLLLRKQLTGFNLSIEPRKHTQTHTHGVVSKLFPYQQHINNKTKDLCSVRLTMYAGKHKLE